MGFNRPSKIQEKALPILLADPPTNFIAQSQSGTGKTAAFALTMLSRVDISNRHPQVIYDPISQSFIGAKLRRRKTMSSAFFNIICFQ